MDSTVPPEPVGSVSPSEHQRHGPETSPTVAMGGRVLVLNATYEPINVCTVRRAVVLLLKAKAEVVERGRTELHSESSTLARPVVIRLVTYVNVPRDAHRRKITRHALVARPGALGHRPGGPPRAKAPPPRRVPPRQRALPVLRLALEPHGRPRDP